MSLMSFDSRNFKIGISVDVVPWARMAKWMTLNTLYCGHKLYFKPAINSWWYVQILRILQMLQFKEKYIVRKNTKIWIISLQYWRSFINTWLFIVRLISEFIFWPKHITEIMWRGYDSCLRTCTLFNFAVANRKWYKFDYYKKELSAGFLFLKERNVTVISIFMFMKLM